MIYFIRGKLTKKIKIGVSESAEKRLKDLQAASPDKLIPLGYAVGNSKEERILHQRFAEYNSHGEWFDECKEIHDFISQCGHDNLYELTILESEISPLKPLDRVNFHKNFVAAEDSIWDTKLT